MLFFSMMATAFVAFAAAAQPNEGNNNAAVTSYDLKKLRQNGAVATVTVQKAMVTVFQSNQVTVTVNKEVAAHSKVIVETAMVTETVKIKHPNPQKQNDHPAL
jgi:hypothetical protein